MFGYIWVCKDINGYVGVFMGFMGIYVYLLVQWICIGTFEYIWAYMDIYGFVLISMGLDSDVWICMGILVCTLLNVTVGYSTLLSSIVP